MERTDFREARERAEMLCVVEGMTPEQAAAAVGVSVERAGEWSRVGELPERRREHCGALREIRRNMTLLRKRLLEKALDGLDPRFVNAFTRMEALAVRSRSAGPVPELTVEEMHRVAAPGEAGSLFQEALERKLALLLRRPEGLSPASLKEIRRILELMESLHARLPGWSGETAPAGLSETAADTIRKRILGLEEAASGSSDES